MREPQESEEVVVFGKEEGLRTFVYMDEEGKPRVAVGGTKRMSADVDVKHGEPAVKIKYKLKFGGRARRFPDYQPAPPGDEKDKSPSRQEEARP